ncbi:MAG TPA: MTH1187 family thiamine-binding protein [Bacteroidales bacterium]|nr:MTH1187 family thiamine-binding protein [Bacteroidales bacterium]
MSVLLEFAMFPTDKGESVSEYVSKVIEMIRNSGVPYKLTAMGTIIETETLAEALDIVKNAYLILEPHSKRVYCSLKMDIRRDKSSRLEGKIRSIEDKIGRVSQ